MTVDECIEIWTHPTNYFPSEREKAVDFAIETMCKYMQIKQIFDMWNDFKYEDDDVLEKVSDILYKGDDIK